MRKKAFLLAAGSAKRWNGISKQKICFNGEMLIDRLIRQIRRYTDDITIIAWDQSLKRPGCAFLDTRHPTASFSHALMLTLDQWSDLNYIFATDTYFTDPFIERVFRTERYSFFGYYTRPPNYLLKNQERAAICLPIEMRDRIERGLISAISEGINTGSDLPNEMIGFCHSDALALYYRLAKMRGIPGFLFWRLWGQWLRGLLNFTPNMIEISDRTSEFDTPEEFKNFCLNRPKYYRGVN